RRAIVVAGERAPDAAREALRRKCPRGRGRVAQRRAPLELAERFAELRQIEVHLRRGRDLVEVQELATQPPHCRAAFGGRTLCALAAELLAGALDRGEARADR